MLMKTWARAIMVILTLCVLSVATIEAAEGAAKEVVFKEGQTLPTAEPGKVWCLINKPAAYKTVTERVLIRPATHYFETTPAEYEWQTETVMTKPSGKKAIFVPATFKTETFNELVQEESFTYQLIPARYEMVEKTIGILTPRSDPIHSPATYKAITKRIMVEPARTQRVKVDCRSRGVPIKAGESKGECYTETLIPARYETVTQMVLDKDAAESKQAIPGQTRTIKVKTLKTPATMSKIVIPAKYVTMQRQVLVEPAHYTYMAVPAEYKKIRKLVMTTPASKRKVELAAQYKTMTHEVLATTASMVWRQCGDDSCSNVASVLDKYGSIPGANSDN